MITISNKPAFVVKNLSFARDGREVFRDFSLTIEPGTHVALLGTNGSGKSTLLELLLGTLLPQSGTIERLHERMAFVAQRNQLADHVPMTVRDAVTMGRWALRGQFRRLTPADHRTVLEHMERLGITELQDRQLADLSGGQRQRAFIAQALTQEAPIILLDEPEAGLDAEARQSILDAIEDEARRGTTVVFATHERESAERASRAVLLRANAGGIIADGDPREILTDEALARVFT